MLAPAAAAQSATAAPPVARISAADLRADLAVLRKAFEELHPGLYRYNTPAQMAGRFAALESEFGRDLTLEEAFLALSRFTAAIRCGHTFPNPNNQSEAVRERLFRRPDKLPFHFRWIDGRMIVTRDLTDGTPLAPGTEILAIDGTPVAVVLERMTAVARADGANDVKRISLLQVEGSEEFETFDIYFPLLFPRTGSTFALRVRRPDAGEVESVTVDALTFEGRRAARSSAPPRGTDAPVWELCFLDERTALLPMRTWVVYDSKWDWRKSLDAAFDTLAERRVANLVIDLRGNEGGSSVGDAILARLVERETPLPSYRRLVRYRRTPVDLDAYLDTWDPSFRDWGSDAVGPADGFYRLADHDDGGALVRPKGPRFAGRLFVLVGPENSSATFEFALAIQELRLGTLVGRTTGGSRRGINGGAFFFLRLPGSGLEVDLPLIGLFPAPDADTADAGVVPDVVVRLTPRDIARGVDAEMEAVRARLGP